MQNDTCYILALIKRDDGERLLLGSGFYEFSAGQKHFNPNQFANDVVELQGTDGQLLAGQVRRSTSQVFEGVIGDGTTSKQMVEQKRREFFLFFRKQHHYTVVYIMPDGTAIKRDRGYITEAPAVQELYQFQPKWRVALAFEDVNYYSYAEDSQGNEIYSFEAELGLANIADGGLIWDANGAISSKAGAKLEKLKGNTFQQTYTGKNLYNKTAEPYQRIHTTVGISGEDITINYTTGTGTYHYAVWKFEVGPDKLFQAGETYTVSCSDIKRTSGTTPTGRSLFTTYATSGQSPNVNLEGVNYPDKVLTFTIPDNATIIGLALYTAINESQTYSNVMIEKSATATSYEPFVGGTASPNPEFPQTIQTATGVQTFAIDGTNYTLDLGANEFCELGTKQDYIWQDGDDWKIHKAVGKYIFSGQEPWTYNSTPIKRIYLSSGQLGDLGIHPAIPTSAMIMPNGKTNKFTAKTFQAFYTNAEGNGFAMSTQGQNFQIGDDSWTDSATAKADTNGLIWYYAQATGYETDTIITDADMIAQLDAIAEAMRTKGAATITATGTNLPIILETSSAGTGGYIWAASSGGGPINVTVNGVDNANPVWHVYGPATNPTLTNSTTGEALTWNGTIPSQQELIIDMGAQTATLEGANVFEFVSGSWVHLEPGTNRISYTAANTTKPSKIYWNEVVG